jgi:hypothetical protein
MSAFARALKRELTDFGGGTESGAMSGTPAVMPGHLALMNMLARAAGYRNFQHFRSQQKARAQLDQPAVVPDVALPDYVHVKRLMRYFDDQGRFTRWPSKFSDRLPCLWVLWSRLTPRRVSTEAEINRALQAQHLFGDHALLRRELCDAGLMTRSTDGREYRRVEQVPPATPLALIRQLAAWAAA